MEQSVPLDYFETDADVIKAEMDFLSTPQSAHYADLAYASLSEIQSQCQADFSNLCSATMDVQSSILILDLSSIFGFFNDDDDYSVSQESQPLSQRRGLFSMAKPKAQSILHSSVIRHVSNALNLYGPFRDPAAVRQLPQPSSRDGRSTPVRGKHVIQTAPVAPQPIVSIDPPRVDPPVGGAAPPQFPTMLKAMRNVAPNMVTQVMEDMPIIINDPVEGAPVITPPKSDPKVAAQDFPIYINDPVESDPVIITAPKSGAKVAAQDFPIYINDPVESDPVIITAPKSVQSFDHAISIMNPRLSAHPEHGLLRGGLRSRGLSMLFGPPPPRVSGHGDDVQPDSPVSFFHGPPPPSFSGRDDDVQSVAVPGSPGSPCHKSHAAVGANDFQGPPPPPFVDSVFKGSLGYGDSGDMCMYQNLENLGAPCQQAIVNHFTFRDQYWNEYQQSSARHPHIGAIVVMLLFLVFGCVAIRKRCKKAKQMLTVLRAINANPELKSAVEAEAGVAMPELPPPCAAGECKSGKVCCKILRCVGIMILSVVLSFFIAILSIVLTMTIIEATSPVDDAGNVQYPSSVTAHILLFLITTLLCLLCSKMARKCISRSAASQGQGQQAAQVDAHAPSAPPAMQYDTTPAPASRGRVGGLGFLSNWFRSARHSTEYRYVPVHNTDQEEFSPLYAPLFDPRRGSTEMVMMSTPIQPQQQATTMMYVPVAAQPMTTVSMI